MTRTGRVSFSQNPSGISSGSCRCTMCASDSRIVLAAWSTAFNRDQINRPRLALRFEQLAASLVVQIATGDKLLPVRMRQPPNDILKKAGLCPQIVACRFLLHQTSVVHSLRQSYSGELPTCLGRKEITVCRPDVRMTGRTRSTSQHKLVAHEFAVVLTKRTTGWLVSGIGGIGA